MPSQRTLPVVDLSAVIQEAASTQGQTTMENFSTICQQLGAVTIKGHGIPQELLSEAFDWVKKLYDLPHEHKMKAPHPKGPIPHRGYSHPGFEKVYSKADLDDDEVRSSGGQSLRKIMDFKESYEIGSEDNLSQPNIWLPEETLPGFRDFMIRFYWVLNSTARDILEALCQSLGLTQAEQDNILQLHSGHNSQLRLLHYPPTPAEQLEARIVARMPAHTDFSSFTLLFQDDCGGLEFQDPVQGGDFLAAKPQPGSLVLNVGDMIQRISNDTYPSATHRVTLPPTQKDNNDKTRMTRARYSIVYFVCPDEDAIIEAVPSLVGTGVPKFERINYGEYGAKLVKYQYNQEATEEPAPAGLD